MSSEEEEDEKSINEENENEEEEESEENSNEQTNNNNNQLNDKKETPRVPKTPSQQNKTPTLTGSQPSPLNSPKMDLNNPINITPKKEIPLPIDNRPPEEIEKEQILQSNMQLELENKTLTQKISKLKQSVIDIQSRLDKEIMQEFLIQQQNINNLTKSLNESNKTISYLQSQLKKKIQHISDISLFNRRYEAAVIENKEMLELIARQDEEIKKYSLYNTKSSNAFMKETNNIKKHEQNVSTIKMSIFECDQTIKKIKERIDKKTQEEQKRIELINDKNKEIEILHTFIDSHKTQISLNSQNEQNLQKQIRRVKQESKKLNTVLNNQTSLKQNESIINKSNNNIIFNEDKQPMLNELQDESNLKEITGLMKKVLEE